MLSVSVITGVNSLTFINLNLKVVSHSAFSQSLPPLSSFSSVCCSMLHRNGSPNSSSTNNHYSVTTQRMLAFFIASLWASCLLSVLARLQLMSPSRLRRSLQNEGSSSVFPRLAHEQDLLCQYILRVPCWLFVGCARIRMPQALQRELLIHIWICGRTNSFK